MKPELKKLVLLLSIFLVLFSLSELARLAKSQSSDLFVFILMLPPFVVVWLYFANYRDRLDEHRRNLPALRTLRKLGYAYYGGDEWKPPIGQPPNFNLIDSLNERITELESDSHIWKIRNEARFFMIGHIVDDLEDETDLNNIRVYLKNQLKYYKNEMEKYN